MMHYYKKVSYWDYNQQFRSDGGWGMLFVTRYYCQFVQKESSSHQHYIQIKKLRCLLMIEVTNKKQIEIIMNTFRMRETTNLNTLFG